MVAIITSVHCASAPEAPLERPHLPPEPLSQIDHLTHSHPLGRRKRELPVTGENVEAGRNIPMPRTEPIIQCPICRGEGILPGPRVCVRCDGIGLRAVQTTKRCGCGTSYDQVAWDLLPLLGIQEDDVEPLELKNCRACGSTLAVVAPPSVVEAFARSVA